MDMEQISREKEEAHQHKINELEKILNQREKDLSELKDAYKGSTLTLKEPVIFLPISLFHPITV